MHRPDPTYKPSCWTGAPPDRLPPRVDWAWDNAVACADAKDHDSRVRQLDHTPGCLGCTRRLRAMAIESGEIVAYPSRGPKPAHQTHIGGQR